MLNIGAIITKLTKNVVFSPIVTQNCPKVSTLRSENENSNVSLLVINIFIAVINIALIDML